MKLKFLNIFFLVGTFGAILGGCQEPYTPSYKVEHVQPALIIQGFINTEGNSSFKISKSVLLEAEKTINGVPGAKLIIEAENGVTYSKVFYNNEGEYQFEHPPLDNKVRYRLSITLGSENYHSDFVDAFVSPPIERIDTSTVKDGVELYLSTNNTESNPKYYRWEYEETWKFSPRLLSYYLIEKNELKLRNAEEMINICFKGENSTQILIGNSDGLNENVVSRLPITLVPIYSEKFQHRYSILVKQYNISKDSYTYWSIMKKNSESVGDIFGSMPSEIRGNIRNVNNPNETIIGWIDAGTCSTKRIYVDKSDLPQWIVANPFYFDCTVRDTLLAHEVVEVVSSQPNMLVLHGIYGNPNSPDPTHYVYGSRRCSDCTLRGTLEKPPFWEDAN